jgi:peptidoglycan hydrolase-like protein with peptidoglycan-binding domain
VAGVALVAVGGLSARALWPGTHTIAAVAGTVPVTTATVVRGDISARHVVPGTLGYQGSYRVLNESATGIITWLPAAGQVVYRGQPLFQVAGQTVRLMYGAVPAWRDLTPGMTSGADVRELQRNLKALGFAPGLTVDGQFGWATEAAVLRWQQAHGMTETGSIPLGAIAFLPGPLRVTGAAAPLGSPAAPGTIVVTGTSKTPSVSVSLDVGGPAVRVGDAVQVTLPSGATASGAVSSVSPVATVEGGIGQAAGQGSTAATAVIPVTIAVPASQVPAGMDQAPVQVAITQQRHQNVLAVPVTALLARPGGGYAVEVTGGAHRLIPVTTGLFDDATGLVEVTGASLVPGLTVEVAQG